LPIALHGPLLATYTVPRPIDPPFAELYPDLVRAQWRLPSRRLLHLVARIDGTPVGYHTWWHHGSTLSLLSGAFGRRLGGNAHAYENVLLASLDLADRLGCRTADFGPTINATKRSLLGSRARRRPARGCRWRGIPWGHDRAPGR
jgi:hypothetical protein